MRVSKQSELAKALNRSRAQVCKWVREPWFPRRETDGWDVEAVRQAIETHVGRRSKPLTRDAALFDAPASGTPVPADAAVLDTLRSAKSTEEQVLDAAFRLASAKIANAAQAGMLGPGDLAGLARASEELRRAREAQLDLAERQKRLVDRDVAAGAVGILVGRMLTVLNNVGNLLAPRVEEWREDPRHHQLDASARARVVREWFEEQVRTMRVEEADQVEAAMREAEEDAGA